MDEQKRKLSKIRRRNAKLYPFYKMFSWDLLVFYAIEYLFYLNVKGLMPAEILIVNGLYLFFRVIMQIPSVIIADTIGRKKSIVLGNYSIILYLLILINAPGIFGVIIANAIHAFGYSIKILCESSLLYDSVSTRGGDGLYSKLDTRGGRWYYILDGLASLSAGYLFVINNYFPIYACLGFAVISTTLSLFFKDVYKVEKQQYSFKGHMQDIKKSFKFAFRSRRMKALILFMMVFYGTIKLFTFYSYDLLVVIGVPNQQFAIIFAGLTFIGGLSLLFKDNIEKTFKNRVLTFISMEYILSCLLIGFLSKRFDTILIAPAILILLAIMQGCASTWYILENKYLKSFTKPETRNKITFAYEFVGTTVASLVSIFGGLLLNFVNVKDGFILMGFAILFVLVLVLDYMRTRIGLKPEQYTDDDIEF